MTAPSVFYKLQVLQHCQQEIGRSYHMEIKGGVVEDRRLRGAGDHLHQRRCEQLHKDRHKGRLCTGGAVNEQI